MAGVNLSGTEPLLVWSGNRICLNPPGFAGPPLTAAIMNERMPRALDPFRFVLIALAGWMNQRQLHAINYLREENRVLREHSAGGDCVSTTISAVG